MKTAIIGGGKGCKSLLEFVLERGLTELLLDVRIVCDQRSHAPGILYAAQRGIRTCSRIGDALKVEGLDLVIELTGIEAIAAEILGRLPPGVRMMDHVMARVFWDLMQTERQVRKEQRQTQRILDSIPDIVLVLDLEKRIQAVNAAFSKFTGMTRGQAYGNFCHDVLCSRYGQGRMEGESCPFDEVIRTGRRVNMVQVREVIPGLEEHFEITMTPLQDRDGRIRQVVEALHPITERVRLKREVEQAAVRFQRFVESAYDLISIKDLEGRYELFNAATAETFGMKPEEVLGKTVHELYPAEIARIVADHDQKVIRRKEGFTFEESFFIQGRERHFSTVRFPLLDYRGEVTGVCTISRDVTEERRLQRELVRADKLAAIGKLAAGVAHEINNPLTGILAYAEDLLEDAEEGDPRADDYRVIIRETMRCREIVRNLLDFARQQKPQIQRAELNDVVERTLALVSKLTLFRGIEIEKDLSGESPCVAGDPYQLQQVVLNLLVNSAESMNSTGKIEITTGLLDERRYCHVTVTDDGPGIPSAVKGKIFEPFFSTKATTHGLGLAVCWGIVERHGGTIEAKNLTGGGAMFRVVLPAMEG